MTNIAVNSRDIVDHLDSIIKSSSTDTDYNLGFVDGLEFAKGYTETLLPMSCNGCKHDGKYENEYEYGYNCPCIRCVRRSVDNYEREEDS